MIDPNEIYTIRRPNEYVAQNSRTPFIRMFCGIGAFSVFLGKSSPQRSLKIIRLSPELKICCILYLESVITYQKPHYVVAQKFEKVCALEEFAECARIWQVVKEGMF